MYTITICCSHRFRKEERIFAKALRKLGLCVYEPTLFKSQPRYWENISEQEKFLMAAGLTYHHLSKIRKSDAVFVMNIGGYIGNSVNLEIGYAAALNKKIFFMEEEKGEYARRVLIDGIARTPKELLKRINNVHTYDLVE